LLWVLPPGLLAIGAVTLFILGRRRRAPDGPPSLNEAEQRKLAAMLQNRPDEN
jgi:cytochrome c-type biogenesis protein CcmH/NrfF